METKRTKYPRTPHLPWSPGASKDDIRLESLDSLELLADIVVTEKLDGENTTLYRDYLHARSLEFVPHPSRSWIRQLHGQIRHDIPAGFRVCGENVFAKHSIRYDSLSSYFLVFAIFQDDTCLSWNDTLKWCQLLNLLPVPTLYRGHWNEQKIKECRQEQSFYGRQQEGYVVRNAGSFGIDEFQLNTAKYVRPNHVTDDVHWMRKPVEANGLAKGA